MDPLLASAPYNDGSLPPARRVEDLLERMSMPEKLAQLCGVWGRQLVKAGHVDDATARRLIPHGVGHISRNSLQKDPRETACDANGLQAWMRQNTRLGIPAIIHEEACAGLMAQGACAFPMPIGLASTFDPLLVERVGEVIRDQLRSVGAHQALAPVLDVARDHRWGRVEETFGEDPYLASRLGVAFVRGVQGWEGESGVACTGKHFVGYSASEGGLNWAPSSIGARALRDEHLPAFAAAVSEAGLRSIMNAYQEIDGVPVAASRELLTDVLRGELQFKGPVVSDYDAIVSLQTYHGVAVDKAHAASLAINAGIDLELPVADCYASPLEEALLGRKVDPAVVDEAVRRVLRLKFELGLFERRSVEIERAGNVIAERAHRTLALEAARSSLVLLQNRDDLLPLSQPMRIAVVGPSAASLRNLQGTYQYPSFFEFQFGPLDGRTESHGAPQGENNVAAAVSLDAASRSAIAAELRGQFPGSRTIADALREFAPAGSLVRVKHGCDINGQDENGFEEALALARDSDVVIAVMGGRSGLARDCTEGEFNDRAALDLPGVQEKLLRALVATGRPVVLMLVNGRPPCLAWAANNVAAIIEAWLPGEEGPRAIAEVVFGVVAPSGRLPVSLSSGAGQMPLHYGHKPSARRSFPYGDYVDAPAAALYPFGHGLTYTEFRAGPIALDAPNWSIDGRIGIRFDLRNVGGRRGIAVPQLYVRRLAGPVTAPVSELKAFTRVELGAGEACSVEFDLESTCLAHCRQAGLLTVAPGPVRISIGASSREIWHSVDVEVTGPARNLTWREIRPATARIRRRNDLAAEDRCSALVPQAREAQCSHVTGSES